MLRLISSRFVLRSWSFRCCVWRRKLVSLRRLWNNRRGRIMIFGKRIGRLWRYWF